MTTDLTVIIVNYNAGAALAATVASLAHGIAPLRWDAVIVDNASIDGSADAAHADARVRVVRNAANVGFARGINIGLENSGGRFVLILNPDCELDAGAVPHLVQEIGRWPRCAIAGPRILDPDGALQESARGDPTLLTGIFGRTGVLSRWLPNLSVVRRNLVAHEAIRTGAASVAVDWVSGACMLARRDALDAVGGFDERYFLYWEDADLCRRLRAAGWETRYVPGASVRHQVGQSSRSARSLANREFHRSAYRYYVTHVVPQRWHPGRAAAWAILNTRAMAKALSRR
jgi:GT2 family glycosyltransferase